VKPANSSRRLVAAFDFATASHFRAIVFLLLCGLVIFLPGFFNIPAIDRDEARFAQATAAWETTATQKWLALYERDIDNLRGALEWAFGSDGDVALGLNLVGHSHVLWAELGLVMVNGDLYGSASFGGVSGCDGNLGCGVLFKVPASRACARSF